MDELLEKAIRDYPIGTKFKSMYRSNDYVVTKNVFSHYGNIYTFDEELDMRCIYDEVINKWAEIIKEDTTILLKEKMPTYTANLKTAMENINTIPFIVVNNKNEKIFEISENGDLILKGVVIANDTDVSEVLTGVGNKLKEMIAMTQEQFDNLKVGETLGEWEILHKFKELLIIEDKRGYDLVDLAKINKLGLKLTPKTFMGLEIKKYDNTPCEINGDHLAYLLEIKENSILVTHQKNGIYSYSDIPTSIRLL